MPEVPTIPRRSGFSDLLSEAPVLSDQSFRDFRPGDLGG